ncbi:MAG: hypothetical protein AUG51_19950 [Acidobacteria bacterium 13_1_20CM_3_53_8]|nr:MAG: hypothetical protein AUG51_19950 [Acidobacteria bacterium 13_1_20CM_3_53_8]
MERRVMGKRFEIINAVPPYQPSERAEPVLKLIENLASSYDKDCVESHKLYITLGAMEQIAHHIGWGEYTKENLNEQGGILLGEVFTDSTRQIVYGVVSAAIAGASAKGSSASLEMSHRTWKEMLDATEAIKAREPDRGLQVIGWYHTHPNNLSVFMSGTDRATQSRLFSRDWQFALVLNPHIRDWRAFFGRDATQCRGFVAEEIEQRLLEPTESFDKGSENVDEGPSDDDEGNEFAAIGRISMKIETQTARSLKLLWLILALFLFVIILEAVIIGLQILAIFLRR